MLGQTFQVPCLNGGRLVSPKESPGGPRFGSFGRHSHGPRPIQYRTDGKKKNSETNKTRRVPPFLLFKKKHQLLLYRNPSIASHCFFGHFNSLIAEMRPAKSRFHNVKKIEIQEKNETKKIVVQRCLETNMLSFDLGLYGM